VSKQRFLVVYDYGTGGVWGLLSARTEEEITERFPSLEIVADRPSWMTDDDWSRIESRMSFDIDDDPPPRWALG